jgi:hypothetical protein
VASIQPVSGLSAMHAALSAEYTARLANKNKGTGAEHPLQQENVYNGPVVCAKHGVVGESQRKRSAADGASRRKRRNVQRDK